MMFLMGQMLFCLLLAFLLGFGLAWFWRYMRSKEPAIVHGIIPDEQERWRKKFELLQKEHSGCKVRIEELEEALENGTRPSPSSKEKEEDWHAPYLVALNQAQRLQAELAQRDAEIASLKLQQAQDQEPANLFRSKPEDVDNLEEISGVGPALHKMLNQLGIYQFRQIASFSPQEVAWVSSNLKSFKNRITRDDWVSQAKALEQAKNQ